MSNWYVDMPDVLTADGESALESIEWDCYNESRFVTFVLDKDYLEDSLRITTDLSELFPRCTFALGDEATVQWRKHRNISTEARKTIETLYEIVSEKAVNAEKLLDQLNLERMDSND